MVTRPVEGSVMRLRIFNIERIALYNGLSRCQVFGLVPECPGIMHQHVAQGYIAAVCGLVADGVFLAEVFSLDDDGGHGIGYWLLVIGY